MIDVKIKLFKDGQLPEFKHADDACADCHAAEDMVINFGTRRLVRLGFAIQLPKGYEAVLRPRSGLSKKGIDIAIGTIDCGYTNEVLANVINNSGSAFEIEKGDRICQLAIRKTEEVGFTIVKTLEDSERGDSGFGSTGV